MSAVALKLCEALSFVFLPPVAFCVFHVITGDRPLITEFEAGAIVGVILLKLIEALRIYVGRSRP